MTPRAETLAEIFGYARQYSPRTVMRYHHSPAPLQSDPNQNKRRHLSRRRRWTIRNLRNG